jgi:hypothetical protein
VKRFKMTTLSTSIEFFEQLHECAHCGKARPWDERWCYLSVLESQAVVNSVKICSKSCMNRYLKARGSALINDSYRWGKRRKAGKGPA